MCFHFCTVLHCGWNLTMRQASSINRYLSRALPCLVMDKSTWFGPLELTPPHNPASEPT
jgi:ribosome biogenesis protein Tsr3